MKAPINATYYNLAEDRFHTTDEITSPLTAGLLEDILDDMRRRANRGQNP
jgi:hypothetical protein